MRCESLKSRIMLPLAAVAAAFVLIVCGGQQQSAAPTLPTSVPPTSTLAPTQTATPLPPLPTATPVPPTPTPVPPPPTQTPAATSVPASSGQTTDALFEEKSFAFLERLTTEFSPRESATYEELAAAHFLRNQLEDLGYVVYVQDFEVSRLVAKLDVSSGSTVMDGIDVFPIAGSAEASETGMLADVGKAFAEDIPGGGLDGKVALIERGTITFQEKVDRVAEAGAVAAIIFNNDAGNFRGRFMEDSRIPAVSVSRDYGLALQALVVLGETDADVAVGTDTLPSRNVIAEKAGESGSVGTVVVGAHYDTTPDTQGASDNGSGLSVVMTMAELIADTEYPFTVRFVLFGAEEIGLFGSRHYVEALAERDIEESIAMLNFDALGSGHRLEFEGSPNLTDVAAEIASDIGARSAPSELPEGASSDHAPFIEAGIPAVFILSSDLTRINSPADDIKWINPTLMGWSVELGMRLLDYLAEDAAR